LAFEPAEPGVMRRPPRDPRAPILGGAFLWRIAFVSVLIGGATLAVFLIEMRLGLSLELSRTLAVNTLVCGQAFYLFNSRFLRESSLSFTRLFTNRVAWLAVGVLAVLQLIFVYAPFMQTLFGSTALELRHWLIPLGIGFAVFLLVEAEKAVFRRFDRGRRPDRRAGDIAEGDGKDHDTISRRAYALWEEAGRPAGQDKKFWQQAEAELAEQARSAAAVPPVVAPPPTIKAAVTSPGRRPSARRTPKRA
jgi:hypothetical protein